MPSPMRGARESTTVVATVPAVAIGAGQPWRIGSARLRWGRGPVRPVPPRSAQVRTRFLSSLARVCLLHGRLP